MTKLTAALLLGSALILTACGSKTETPEKMEETTVKTDRSDVAHKGHKGVSNARTYTDAGKTDDDHLWLEEVEGDAALAKVKVWNNATKPRLQNDSYQTLKSDLLEIYNSPEKLARISYRNGEAHNFWQDETNIKGVWRKTSLDSYNSDNPTWETVLDVDALAKTDGENWVYKGNSCLAPEYERCMVNLSDGGKDAVTRREFNTLTKSFVKDGFYLPESKGSTAWINQDQLLVGVDFGEGTMTESGYPMITKLWTRGTPLADAQELMRGEVTDVGVWPTNFENADGENEILIIRSVTFYESENFWIPQSGGNAFKPVKLPIPRKSNLSGQFKDQILLTLQENWRGHKSGAVLSFSAEEFMKSGKIETLNVVFAPGARQSINNFGVTKDAVLMSISDNVSGSAHLFDFNDGKWSSSKLPFPENGNVSIGSTNDKESIAFVTTESFLDPDTLWTVNTSDQSISKTKSLPHWFDSSSMVSKQFEATSSDGTKIPYFVIHKKDMDLDGDNPTLLYGYGGFEVSLNPSYSATIGQAWLEKGGVYVLANIRGGGEFGPDWHQAGLKTKRQIVYDDFISIAEDLIDRKITSPQHLGIHGGSNGGLLMGVMMTQRPDLFNAIAIGVPLLDMNRYDKLLAGASWVGEYGDPDDTGAEGAFIRNLSPYHNIDPDGAYPEAFIYTSTKDDRVHPGHARKYAQRLEDYGIPFLYYENIDGGHSAAANLAESAHKNALIYNYFYEKLK